MTTDQCEERTDDTTFEPATLASDLRVVRDVYVDLFAGFELSQWDQMRSCLMRVWSKQNPRTRP